MKKIALMLAACLLISMLPAPVLADDADGDYLFSAPVDADADIADGIAIGEPAGEAPEDAGEAAPGDDPEGETARQGAAREGRFNADGEQEGEPISPEPTTEPAAPLLAASEATLGVGETYAIEASLPEGVEGDLSFASEDAAVAEVGADGAVTAVAPGDTVILVRAGEGPAAEFAVHVRKAPDAVRFARKKLKLGKGERVAMPGVILGGGDGECAGAYTVTSSKPKIVKVYVNGDIKGLRVGKARLTVTTYNGVTATCTVNVLPAPQALTLTVNKPVLGVDEAGRARFSLPEGTAGGVSFTSADPAIVEIDAATGRMRGLAVGRTTVAATAFNGVTEECAVEVKPAPQSLTLEPQQLLLGVGMKLGLEAVLDEGAAGTVKLTSASKKIAKVSGGVVKGVAVGETVIRAKTYNGLTAECAVVVKPAPEAVTLPYEVLTLGVGETAQLTPDVGDSYSTFTYKSYKPRIVTVSETGEVYGVRRGSAYVRVKTYNGKSVKIKVVVLKAPKKIRLDRKKVGLGVDETVRLTATLPANSAGTVRFSSKRETVAVVDPETGAITAVAPGKANIYARAYNGVYAKCRITVYPKPTWVDLGVEKIKLGVGQVYQLEPSISPDSRSPFYYASQDKAVAKVDAQGAVHAVAVGETIIEVSTNAEGVSDSVKVNVLPAPDSLSVRRQVKLNVGENYRLKPVIPSGTIASFTFETDDADVATVSEAGEIFAAGRGTANITVTTHNGLSASTKVKVYDPTYPEAVTITNPPDQIKIGDTWQLEYTCEPETAQPELVWSSSREYVATVSEDGLITAVGSGYTYIQAQSARNPEIVIEFKMAVQMDEHLTMIMPLRQTDIAGIPANLEMVETVRKSAIWQINQLQSAGRIGNYEAWKRRDMVNNIFQDYAFPWMTPEYQPYWNRNNSEGGLKDFKPGIVYYGMPYISGSGNNRRYNRAKALSESRYTDSGHGYYLLNRGNLLNGKYVGNDCSGLVDQAIWGTNSGHSSDRTADIAVSSAYKTISDYSQLRPGDLMCKAYAHVFMFLYYTDPDHTEMVYIENGGAELGTNTVHCTTGRVYYFKSAGYKIRRLAELG